MFSIREIIFGLAATLKPPLTTEAMPSEPKQAVTGWTMPTGSGDVSVAGNGDTTRATTKFMRICPLVSFRTTANRADAWTTFGCGPLAAPLGRLIRRPRCSRDHWAARTV